MAQVLRLQGQPTQATAEEHGSLAKRRRLLKGFRVNIKRQERKTKKLEEEIKEEWSLEAAITEGLYDNLEDTPICIRKNIKRNQLLYDLPRNFKYISKKIKNTTKIRSTL